MRALQQNKQLANDKNQKDFLNATNMLAAHSQLIGRLVGLKLLTNERPTDRPNNGITTRARAAAADIRTLVATHEAFAVFQNYHLYDTYDKESFDGREVVQR